MLSTSLAGLLVERLALLTPDSRALAEFLAVLGRPADDVLLKQLWPDERLRLGAQADLLAHQVVREQSGALVVKEDRLCEMLVASLPADRRRALHLQVAAALAVLPEAERAERLRHYAEARAWSDVLREGLALGDTTLAAGHLEQLVWSLKLARAAKLELQVARTDERSWALLLLEESYAKLSDRGPTWQAALDELGTVAAMSGRVEWQVEALLRRGQAMREQGQPQQAEETLRTASVLADAFGLRGAEAHARTALASVLDDRGAIDDALQETTQAV